MSKVICLLGGSGSGKDTIKNILPIPHLISYRTRPKRETEVDGVDGYFVDDAQYEYVRKHNFLAAYGLYDGYHYWVTKRQLTSVIIEDKPLLYVVDGQGLLSLKENIDPSCIVSIWIDVPECILIERMRRRGDTEEVIQSRISYFNKICNKEKGLCDYVVDGVDTIDHVTSKISYIILKELFGKDG